MADWQAPNHPSSPWRRVARPQCFANPVLAIQRPREWLGAGLRSDLRFCGTVHDQWAKMAAMAEGARIASREFWKH